MSNREHAKRRDRIEFTVVMLIFVILLLIIGFLLYRIMHSNIAAPSLLPTAAPAAESVTEVTPSPVSTPEPTPETTPEPEPTPEPTPDPAQYINIATSKTMEITKQPGGESLYAGDNAIFIAHATNEVSREWRFVSPDYDREIVWNAQEIKTAFPGIDCVDGDTDTFLIYSVPKELDGWYAVCLYTDNAGGKLATEGAKVIVAAP